MGIDDAGGAPGVAVVEFDEVVVSEMIAGPEHREAPVELLHDGIAADRVHDAVQGAETAAAGKAPADSLDVARIDGEAVAGDQFANGNARFEACETLFQGAAG